MINCIYVHFNANHIVLCRLQDFTITPEFYMVQIQIRDEQRTDGTPDFMTFTLYPLNDVQLLNIPYNFVSLRVKFTSLIIIYL